MKLLITAIFLAVIAPVFGDEKLFQKKGCSGCHHDTIDRVKDGLGPSIAQIKKAYNGKKNELILFLKGQNEPRLYPDHYFMMKPQLDILKGEKEKVFGTLADYLLR